MLMSSPAHAISRDMKSIFKAGTMGVIGGTLLGLATVPVTKKTRNIFIGSSVGLYLGLLVGVYYIHHREEFRSEYNRRVALGNSLDSEFLLRHEDKKIRGAFAPQTSLKWSVAF